MTDGRTVVIGAGPAGLTAAHELTEMGLPAVVLERDTQVGGIARTVSYRGYRFDVGGHRFFTKSERVQRFWEDLLGDDFLVRNRLSRIFYDGQFFSYPLRAGNALRGLGLSESVRIVASYAKAQLFPIQDVDSFDEWVTNRFGRRLFEIFFKSYTEKVWGIPCSEIGAEWAAQRIKSLDLKTAVLNAILGRGGNGDGIVTTLIDQFHYPRLGPGMLWERCRDRLAARGVETRLEHDVVRIHHRDGRVAEVTVRLPDGTLERLSGEHFVSSMPLRNLVHSLEPSPPTSVIEAAESLRYRDFLTVVLITDVAELFPDHWIYIHEPDVEVGRIQNFKNWSPDMVPDRATTSVGLEYFVQEDDELWSARDEDLLELGTGEMASLGLLDPETVRDGTVLRMRKAYPVYDDGYQEAVSTLREYLVEEFENLEVVGRNGQHRYNNQDHSMLTGMYAARNVAGAEIDIWSVNEEKEYHEEDLASRRAAEAETGSSRAEAPTKVAERSVPRRVDTDPLEKAIRGSFSLYDPTALGGAVGVVAGVGLFLQTAVLLLQGGPNPGPTLSLLGHYLFGFQVTWPGALVGLVEAGCGGFLFGYVVGRAINSLVTWNRRLLERQLEMTRTVDPLLAEEGG